MWFVFPQIAGPRAQPDGAALRDRSLQEARAYLAHPVLGPRLRECASDRRGQPSRSAEQIFGAIDAMKLRSSMTLFHLAAPGEETFARVLDRFFDGQPDPATEQRI